MVSQSHSVAATLSEPAVSELSAADLDSEEDFFSEDEEEESEEDHEEDCEEDEEEEEEEEESEDEQDEAEEAEEERQPATQEQLDQIPTHLWHLVDPSVLAALGTSSACWPHSLASLWQTTPQCVLCSHRTPQTLVVV